MKFCEKLQMLRKENKLSQEELASQLDVSRQSVSKWELGTTYPEMDKLLSLCKIFKCGLDDLTNESITNINVTEEKNNSNLVDNIFETIKKVYLVFTNMSFKELIICFIEMGIVLLILLFLKLPIDYIIHLANNMFSNFGTTTYDILSSVFRFILYIIYFIIAVIIFCYIFKIKYLDNIKIKDKKEELKEDKKESNEEIDKPSINVITENKHSIIDTLANIAIIFIKFLVICFTIPFIFLLALFAFSLIIILILLFKGIISIGAIIGLIGCIILNIFLLLLVYYFIFNKKVKVKQSFIIFIIGLIITGVGAGIFTVECTNYTYINGVPEDEEKIVETFNINMSDNLITNYYDDIVYEEKNIDNINVELTYYDQFGKYNVYQNGNYLNIDKTEDLNFSLIKDTILEDIKNKKIYSYDDQLEVKIIANKENIKKLKDNYENRHVEIENNISEQYEITISGYQNREEQILEQLEELQEQNNLLQEQLDEYKETIKGLLD